MRLLMLATVTTTPSTATTTFLQATANVTASSTITTQTIELNQKSVVASCLWNWHSASSLLKGKAVHPHAF